VNPSRRSVLAGGAVGLATACTSRGPSTPAVVSRDDVLRQRAASREEALLQLYNRVLAHFPALAAELQPLRAHHEEHRRALGVTATVTALATPALAGRTPAEARARLAAMERGVAADHGHGAVLATRDLAPLLASLSASEASHAAVL
jgi:hypothetical protein